MAMDLKALKTSELAKLLRKLLPDATDLAAAVDRTIEAGAPTNTDGTVNLVHYAAWLVRELHNR